MAIPFEVFALLEAMAFVFLIISLTADRRGTSMIPMTLFFVLAVLSHSIIPLSQPIATTNSTLNVTSILVDNTTSNIFSVESQVNNYAPPYDSWEMSVINIALAFVCLVLFFIWPAEQMMILADQNKVGG